MHFAALFALAALADPYCSEVAKLAEGAREPIPFQTMRDANYKPQLLTAGCFPGGVGYFCQQSLLPPEVTGPGTAKRLAACLPDAKITVEKRVPNVSETVVTGSGLEISVEESGSDGAKAGRILRIQITADR
ncbi:MAG: hypothetical protein EON59_17030 [Alphaproteobacteria bacterium]|nr:MAG: hypothetical protein EON59_17030 [Alphaproteobacteria bacterium]